MMNNTREMANRMCTKMLTLAAAAVLVGGTAVAQSGTASQPTNSGAGSMNGAAGSVPGTVNSPAGTMQSGTAGSGSMNSGAAGTMQNGTAGGGSMNTGTGMQNGSGSMGSMPMSGSSAMGSAQDKKFAKVAIAGGLAEIQTSQLALQKSNSDDVKKFAQQMIDDHTKLNNQMMPIAQQLGVTPPTEPMPHDKAIAAKLQAMSGDQFDKAYMKAQVKDHMKDDKDFMKESSSGQNQQEKDAATQGDTIIKQHLQMAQDIAKAHGAMGGSGNSGSSKSM